MSSSRAYGPQVSLGARDDRRIATISSPNLVDESISSIGNSIHRSRTYMHGSFSRVDATILPPAETTRPSPQRTPSVSSLLSSIDREVGRNTTGSVTLSPSQARGYTGSDSPTLSVSTNRTGSRINRPNITIADDHSMSNLSLANYSQHQHQQQQIRQHTVMIPNPPCLEFVPSPSVQPTFQQRQQQHQQRQMGWQNVQSHGLDTSIVDFRSVMMEQEQEARYREIQYMNESRRREEETAEETARLAAREQEEEFVRLAIEMSLSEHKSALGNPDDSDSSETLEMFDDADEDRRLRRRAAAGRFGNWRISSNTSDRVPPNIDGREVVLEMARRFLGHDEVEVIRDALRQHNERDSASNAYDVYHQQNPEPSSTILSTGHASTPQLLNASSKIDHERLEENPDTFVSAFVTAASSNATSGSMTSHDEITLRDASSSLSNLELYELKRALLLGTYRGGERISASRPGCVAVKTFTTGTRRELYPETYTHQQQQQVPLRSPQWRPFDLTGAENHLSARELQEIQMALHGDEILDGYGGLQSTNCNNIESQAGLSEESTEVLRVIQEADEMEEWKSLELARQLQLEQDAAIASSVSIVSNPNNNRQQNLGNIRTMTRQEYENEKKQQALRLRVSGLSELSVPVHEKQVYINSSLDGHFDQHENLNYSTGFRMNSNRPFHGDWRRLDQNSIVGPNNEIRTKHDSTLDGATNVERLGLESDSFPSVGNKAYNSFLQSVKKSTKKGVEMSGTGRAGSDTDATRGGAMDPRVRTQISKAVNNQYIERCNGVVKEGKEAIIYHADKGLNSNGYDVAIKVFKRIQEFRGRGEYVDGDPRYATAFKNASTREQIELWTEKEFRNLVRASRAGVPVPSPLFHKENVLFMRFLGLDGWPVPQLREVDLRKGSRRWESLFWQVFKSIRLLYHRGRLVHGDLSEYNVLVAPSYLVENTLSAGFTGNDICHEGGPVACPNSSDYVNEELQAVLIDFGQAVDIHHPNSLSLLERDLDRIVKFFAQKEIDIMSVEDALTFVTSPLPSLLQPAC